MRRKALAVLAVLALLMPMFLAIGGMSAVRAQDASPGASPAVDTSISGELNVAMVANPQMVALQKLAPEFQKIYPNIKLNLLVLPENEVRDRIRTDVSTQAGQFDVVTIGMFEAADYAKQGWSLDVGTPLQADPNYDYQDIFPAMVSALSGDDGKLYAAPFYGESSMVFYRKDLFQAAGLTMPDKPTWDDIQGFAQKLHKPDSGQYGICLRGLPGWGEQGAPLTSVINAFGGRWFDENWKSQLASDKSAKAIKFYTDLVKNYGEPSATTSGFTECENLFIQGKVAMWYDATSAADLLADPKQNPQAANTGLRLSADGGDRQRLVVGMGVRDRSQDEAPGRRPRLRQVGDLQGLRQPRGQSARLGLGAVRRPRLDLCRRRLQGIRQILRRPRPEHHPGPGSDQVLRRCRAVQGVAVCRGAGVRHPGRPGDEGAGQRHCRQ